MERALYEIAYPEDVALMLEEMRKKCLVEFGVTLTGNRFNLHWRHKGELINVHMIIESVEDGREPEEDE